MDTMEAISSRRSIRSYQEKEIPDEIISKLLEAARWAPSAGNKQPWRFVVIKEPYKIKLIKSISMGMRETPPLIMVACIEKGTEAKVIEDTKYLDIGAAIQNLLLAAHSQGIGACWIVSTNWSGVSSAIDLNNNKNIQPISLISLGYPSEESLRERKRKPLNEIAYRDSIKKEWDMN
jgi:nitroreductase